MTHVINGRNVNDALISGLWYLHNNGIESNSRNGRVLVAPSPVVTEYSCPNERVLFPPLRDANPFFHLFESLWMLAGRNDVAFPAYFAKQVAEYSDDGKTLHGAYGYIWRTKFDYDQIYVIIKELIANPQSRRCVLSMWNPSDRTKSDDIGYSASFDDKNDLFLAVNGGKDVPCNTHVYFDTLNEVLNMTVSCRSNDIVWGCYGANAVHFSMLHEYMALATGIPQGVYRQFSNNYHLYLDRPDVKRLFNEKGEPLPMFAASYDTKMRPYPMWERGETKDGFDYDLLKFFRAWAPCCFFKEGYFKRDYFEHVVLPLNNAYSHYQRGNLAGDEPFAWADACVALDWRKAAIEWLERRTKNAKPK